jgi:cbb3-type cytochrome oxidase maturation protein
MYGIMMLLSITLVLGGAFLWMFISAARRGEFDDLDDPPQRMLQD